jgi:hypothetical protein
MERAAMVLQELKNANEKSTGEDAMTGQATIRRERRRKTWSAFGDLGRKPNEYEIVTHNMNHTTRDTPLEMGPAVHGNVWLKTYRDQISLKVPNWDEFRDPDQMTYKKYMQGQDEQETYVDSLLEEYTEGRGSDGGLSDAALSFLQLCMTPTRYLVHGQQMMSAYIQQLATSSYVATCAAFQTADQLRRVQRIAYRTKQLDNTHPAHRFGSCERETWEKEPLWQPMREATEQLLITFEWDRAFVATNLVIKPICDELFLRQFARIADALGDPLDSLLATNLYRDAERSQRWTIAAANHAIANAPSNREILSGLARDWCGMGEAIVEAGATMLTRFAPQLVQGEIEAEVHNSWNKLQLAAGLKHST